MTAGGHRPPLQSGPVEVFERPSTVYSGLRCGATAYHRTLMRICGYRMLLLLVWWIAVLSVMSFGQAEPKGDYINVNGKRLWYRIEGRGAPLLVIPGGPGASHTYLWPSFSIVSRDFRVIYFDPYGRGQSDRAADPAEYTFVRDVDEIEGLRRALRLDKINIYGQSYGAMVAQAYALKYPDSVSHLILASPFHSAEMWQRGNNDAWNLELQNHIPETWARLQEMRKAGRLSCEKEYMEAQDEIPMTQSYYFRSVECGEDHAGYQSRSVLSACRTRRRSDSRRRSGFTGFQDNA